MTLAKPNPSLSSKPALCLACASELRPRAPAAHTTRCCARPICAPCIATSPRLARYDPCLACLSGVRAAGRAGGAQDELANVDGGVRDADLFTLGDDDEDEDGGPEDNEAGRAASPVLPPSTPPPAYSSSALRPSPSPPHTPAHPAPPPAPANADAEAGPRVYHLRPADTLHGLALRFHIPARTLCSLNRLPPSTLSTTPHLLHTRSSILLPSAAGPGPTDLTDSEVLFDGGETNEEREERERKRAAERAAKRLQVLAKEADWRIARAYVALADDPATASSSDGADASFARALKAKEAGAPVPAVDAGLQARALDAYLEDEEWEVEMRAAGVKPARAAGFPGCEGKEGRAKGKAKGESSRWSARLW